MNRKTASFLLLFAILGIWVFFLLNEEAPQPPPAIEIPGFLTDPGVAVVDPYHLKTDFTRIEITRLGEQMIVVKSGEVWKMVSPVEAEVDQGKVRALLLPLQTPSKSSITKAATDEDLAVYGLDPAHAVTVDVYQDDTLFAEFTVGSKEERPGTEGRDVAVDTWIRYPHDGPIARINDKNLFDPYQVRARDLRVRGLFSFTTDKIIGVDMRYRPSENRPPLSIERKGGSQPWTILSPPGFSAGNIQGLLTAISGLEAVDYLSDTPLSESGLGDKDDTFSAVVTLASGKKVEIRLGKEQDENVFASITDVPGEVLISRYSAKHLHRSIDDIRQKKVFQELVPTLRKITLNNGELVFEKEDSTWRMTHPKGLRDDPAQIQNLVKDLEIWSVTQFHPGKALGKKGLAKEDAPSRITLTSQTGTTSILVGEEREKVHWAMNEDERDEVWMVTSYMAGQLRGRSPNEFRHHRLFELTRDDIVWVKLTHPNETLRLDRNPSADNPDETWIVSRGEERILKPRKSEVNYLLTSLASLLIKSFSNTPREQALLKEGAFQATFGLKDGSTQTVWISEMEPFANEVYAHVPSCSSWAGEVFTINKFQARNIQKKFKHFKEKTP